MNGLLVRVGIDSTDGRWNAPVISKTGEFAYVTITECKPLRKGLERKYDEFTPAINRLGDQLPTDLLGQNTHLDPDFEHLTYGDQGQRARQITNLGKDDLLVFFAALRPVDGPQTPLLYAIIGLYVIQEIVPATSVPRARWSENAHTRRIPNQNDIVIRAKPGVSGRLRNCIPIGEYRDKAYRVRSDLLKKWKGLNIKNGFIQRSVRLPKFENTEAFYDWFKSQKPNLINSNNLP